MVLGACSADHRQEPLGWTSTDSLGKGGRQKENQQRSVQELTEFWETEQAAALQSHLGLSGKMGDQQRSPLPQMPRKERVGPVRRLLDVV